MINSSPYSVLIVASSSTKTCRHCKKPYRHSYLHLHCLCSFSPNKNKMLNYNGEKNNPSHATLRSSFVRHLMNYVCCLSSVKLGNYMIFTIFQFNIFYNFSIPFVFNFVKRCLVVNEVWTKSRASLEQRLLRKPNCDFLPKAFGFCFGLGYFGNNFLKWLIELIRQ